MDALNSLTFSISFPWQDGLTLMGTFSAFVEDEEETHEFGRLAARRLRAFTRGWDVGWDEKRAEELDT